MKKTIIQLPPKKPKALLKLVKKMIIIEQNYHISLLTDCLLQVYRYKKKYCIVFQCLTEAHLPRKKVISAPHHASQSLLLHAIVGSCKATACEKTASSSRRKNPKSFKTMIFFWLYVLTFL